MTSVLSFMTIPYRLGGTDREGADCFGLVKIVYDEVLGLPVDHREAFGASSEELSRGYQNSHLWSSVDEPRHMDVVVMSRVVGSKSIPAGHCGILWQDRVLHTRALVGVTLDDINDPRLKINGFVRHVELCQH